MPDSAGRLRWCFDGLGLQDLLTEFRAAELWAAIDAIRCPTLVVRGEHSPALSPATAAAMVGRLRAGSLATVASAAHDLGVERRRRSRGSCAPSSAANRTVGGLEHGEMDSRAVQRGWPFPIPRGSGPLDTRPRHFIDEGSPGQASSRSLGAACGAGVAGLGKQPQHDLGVVRASTVISGRERRRSSGSDRRLDRFHDARPASRARRPANWGPGGGGHRAAWPNGGPDHRGSSVIRKASPAPPGRPGH